MSTCRRIIQQLFVGEPDAMLPLASCNRPLLLEPLCAENVLWFTLDVVLNFLTQFGTNSPQM